MHDPGARRPGRGSPCWRTRWRCAAGSSGTPSSRRTRPARRGVIVPCDGVPRADPDDDHDEEAGQEDLERVEHRLQPGDLDAGARGWSATRGGSGRGRPARRRCRAARAGRRRCRWRCWTAGPSGGAGGRCGAGAGRGAGATPSISSGTPISTTRPSVTEVCSRITETRRNETIAPANRARHVHHLADVGEVVGADRDDLAGRDLARQGAAEADGLAGDQLDDAVGRDQPVGDREPVPHDAGWPPGPGRSRTARRPTSTQLARVSLAATPSVDGAADHGRHHGLRAHPDDAEEHAPDEGAPLAARHPPQEPPRATGAPAYRGGRGGVGAPAPRYGCGTPRRESFSR